MTQYATPSDMLARYDARLLGDLASDNDVEVDPTAILTDVNLQAALEDASAAIDSAVSVGDRYTPAQMAALSTTAASLVRRLACDLTLIYMKRRRGRFSDADKPFADEVAARLASIRKGEDYLMLGTQTEAAASVIKVTGPCLVQVGPTHLRTIVQAVPLYYPQMPGRRGYGNCGNGEGY